MKQYLILLDIGGSFIKTAKIDLFGTSKLEFSKSPITKFINETGYVREINPTALLEKCVFELSKNYSSEEEIVGIFITGQMGGWVLTDSDNRARTNLVSWQDMSVLEHSDKYQRIIQDLEKELGTEWKFNSGNELRPGLPLISIMSKLNELDLKRARFHTLLSFVASNLVTDYEYVLNSTDFASTGMLNIIEQQIRIPDSLSILDFPKISQQTVQIGTLQNTSIPVFAPIGDQQASLNGSGLDINSMIVNIGTGGQVAKMGSIECGKTNQIRPYFNNSYIVTKTHLPSGRLIKNFLKVLLEREVNDYDFSLLEDIEFEKSKYTSAPITTFTEPHINSLRDIYGHKETIRIFLASLSKEYKNSIKELGISQIKKIVFAGGVGQKIKYISRFIQDNISLKVEIAPVRETTLKGLENLGRSYFN
jgi:sugar (pentulose or hexulose) kinase